MNLYVNQLDLTENSRSSIYSGDIYLNTNVQASHDLCEFASDCITAAFNGETDHQSVHKKMEVKQFVQLVTELKRNFTNSLQSKELIRSFVKETGADPREYLLDVPRIRVVPNYNYLHAGVSYAYKPHRDTWYGSVSCQINTWMPVHTISTDQAMFICPAYFAAPVRNNSRDWSLSSWINTHRSDAEKNITEEVRPHPVPLEFIDSKFEMKIAANKGEIIIFSGSHLHGTVPNNTDETRFSIDFRLMHLEDLKEKKGAVNVDSATTDAESGYKDYFHVSDFRPFQGP